MLSLNKQSLYFRFFYVRDVRHVRAFFRFSIYAFVYVRTWGKEMFPNYSTAPYTGVEALPRRWVRLRDLGRGMWCGARTKWQIFDYRRGWSVYETNVNNVNNFGHKYNSLFLAVIIHIIHISFIVCLPIPYLVLRARNIQDVEASSRLPHRFVYMPTDPLTCRCALIRKRGRHGRSKRNFEILNTNCRHRSCGNHGKFRCWRMAINSIALNNPEDWISVLSVLSVGHN